MIPLFKVAMHDDADKAVSEVLHSGYIGEGKQVRAFTDRCARVLNNKDVIATNSCTSAIEIALRIAGVKPGDTVISTPMTCLATNMPILGLGANIAWADVKSTTGCIDWKSVEEQLEKNRNIRAVICVHWGGYPCNLVPLWDMTFERGIPLIEDAAHAWGSSIGNLPIGSKSDFSCFSFQAIKHLTTGDGGLLSLGRHEDYKNARLMKWFGLDRDLSPDMRCTQDPPVLGFKMHMNDVAAAIGLANFAQSFRNIQRAKENAAYYNSELAELKHVRLPLYKLGRESSYWLYPVLVDDQKAFINFMQEQNIAASKVHERNDMKTLFKAFKKQLPGVDYFDSHQVNIPVGWWVSDEDRFYIVEKIKEFDNGYADRCAS